MKTLLTWLHLLVAASLAASPRTFVISADAPGNQVNFHSEATLESFDGRTTAVTGEVKVDPAVPSSGPAAWFQVDLRELDTGIDLRNRHMRERHLHTGQYPTTRFTLKRLSGSPGALAPGVPVKMAALGEFLLHGVAVERTIAVTVTLHEDGLRTAAKHKGPVLHLRTTFPVTLDDHGIPRPELLSMKMAGTMEVTVDVWAIGT